MIEHNTENTLSIPQTAEMLSLSVNKVRRLLEDKVLASLEIDGEQRVPEGFILNGQTISGLRGTMILLTDSGLSNEESIAWLHEENEELLSTPLEALRKGHKAPVRRAVQLLA